MSHRVSALLIVFAIENAVAARLDVYISAPGVQSSFVTGGVTEDFNSLNTGNRFTDYNSAIGTYDLSFARRLSIQAPNQFGGASNTRYAAFGAQSNSAGPIPLQLNGPQDYFGFWWSAGDSNNGVTFYSGSVLLARFSSAEVVAALSPITGMVIAVNGTPYANSSYYGNPNNGQNTGEPYAYVHVLGVGMTFDRLVFDNSGSTATGFESDNHTVHLGAVTVPGSAVFIKSMADVAEPATTGCALIGLSLVIGAQRRYAQRRRRAHR